MKNKKLLASILAILLCASMILSSCNSASSKSQSSDLGGSESSSESLGTSTGISSGESEKTDETEAPNPGENVDPNPGESEKTDETEAPNPGENVDPNPGENENPNPGENVDPNPGENENPNPGENVNPNPGENENPDSGENENPNPGENVDPNPGENVDPNPGENVDPNPGENENPNPGENENPNPGENENPPVAVPPTVIVNGASSEWSLSEGISASVATSANTQFDVNIPVTKAGAHTLSFNASLGLTRTFTNGSRKVTVSLPKTVFSVGESIPLFYSTSGLSENDLAPWLGLAKTIGQNNNGTHQYVDKYFMWQYVNDNTSGVIDLRTMTGASQAGVESYRSLPEGEYKIYFIDENSGLNDTANWLISEPINISVVATPGTSVTRSSSAYGNASMTVANNIMCEGGTLRVDYSASALVTFSSTKKPWIAMGKRLSGVNYYTHWAYTERNETSYKAFSPSSANSSQGGAGEYKALKSGSYSLYYLFGNTIDTGYFYVEPIGINVAPSYTIGARVGGASIMNAADPYNIPTVSANVTVTDADVARGYITVSFDLSSLPANSHFYFNVNNVSLT